MDEDADVCRCVSLLLSCLILTLIPIGPAGFFSSLIFDFHSSVLTRCLAVIVRVRFSMYHNMRNKSTIPALFARMVTQHPNKPALIYEATGEVRTHHRL